MKIKVLKLITPEPAGLDVTFVVADGKQPNDCSILEASTLANRLTKAFEKAGGDVLFRILTAKKVGDLFPEDSESRQAIASHNLDNSPGSIINCRPENAKIVHEIISKTLISRHCI